MEPERYRKIKVILEEALEREPDERLRFLEERCSDDPALRREVEALLLADEMAERFLEGEHEKESGDEPQGSSPSLDRGQYIGPYRVLQLIGEGGMGEVYEAEQQKPVRRKVALKLVKLGMDTRQVVARFESERQALALMDHPNIASVFDGGATEHGRPYFVMEYVKGVPISEYCDTHRLSTSERLGIFLQVCEGVHHAHQKGIIHRDLKPSNVLITVLNERPVPKIIDFGVAKATAHRLTEGTFFTELGQLIGTPEYMSPEQAEMTGLDIDTRSDVYSLGVLLYELLTGAQPFDWTGARKGDFDEIRRKIREEEPSTPSTRVTKLGGTARVVAGKRRTDVSGLARQLSGDLDWITMKALEKDRTRRYSSVPELAADIVRHMKHEPVNAGPASTLYRVRKFVKRHRLGVAASVLVFLAMGIAVAGVSIGLVRSTRAERRARDEAERADQEARTSTRVSEFLVDLFEVADPSKARGETITAREILERGAGKVTSELQDQPLVQARLMDTMGRVYHNLGLYPEAESLLEEALRTRERLLGEEGVDVASSLYHLGTLYRDQGKYDEASNAFRRSLAIRENLLGQEHLMVIETMERLAQILTSQGNFAEAEPIFQRALETCEKNYGSDHESVAGALSNLGNFYAMQGKLAEAEPFFHRALDIRTENLGEYHPRVAIGTHNLATLYKFQGRYTESESYFHRALALKQKVFGENHPDTGNSLIGLADLYVLQGRYAEAEPLFQRARAVLDETVSEDHPLVAETLLGLANLRRGQSRYREAEPLYQRALAIREKRLGPNHPAVAEVLEAYVDFLRLSGREEEAEILQERVAAAVEKNDGT